jgi:hypothetical protein
VLGEQALVAELLESALNGAQRWWVMERADELLDRRAAESLDSIEDLAVELVWGTNGHPRTALLGLLPAFEVAGDVRVSEHPDPRPDGEERQPVADAKNWK